ncbi:hypothetical protein F5Y07DRAFT_355729 [Xylaria sp. FL0933]|nr:hypothetical protein F5Y07DRAFT_355729 [Xylaria sp. FL0933]
MKMSSPTEKGPVWSNGEWISPCRPPTILVGTDLTFTAQLRHVVCNKHATPTGSQSYSPTCVSEVKCRYTGTRAYSFCSQSSSADCNSPQTCKCGRCHDTQSDIDVSNIEILDNLDQAVGPLTNVIRCPTCGAGSAPRHGGKVVVLCVYIVWEDGVPGDKELKVGTSPVTPRSLALMRRRGKADYIQVDFVTLRDDEDERRASMLKSLGKLAKKASKHCNR